MLAAICICFVIIAVPFIAYPGLLWLHAKTSKRHTAYDDTFTPPVDLIICAFNEADVIEEKIKNCLNLHYPNNLLNIWIASDGCTDETEAIVERYAHQGIRLLKLPRQGKAHTLTHAVNQGSSPVLAFSDANSMWQADAVRQLVAPLADPDIGGVAGNQVYEDTQQQASGEKTYWDFDRLLKTWQSEAGNTISATGAIYSIRRTLFEAPPPDATDDFMISTGVIAANKRLVFNPKAIATERPAASSKTEFKRKVRIVTRGLRSVYYRRALLNPNNTGLYAGMLFVHKLWRRLVWIPLLTVAILSSTSFWTQPMITLSAIGCWGLLAAAALGLFVPRTQSNKLISVATFIVTTNAACAVACYNFLTGKRMAKWDLPKEATTP